MPSTLVLPYLTPRPNPAAQYLKRRYRDEEENPPNNDSELLKSIKQAIGGTQNRYTGHAQLYPSFGLPVTPAETLEEELVWNNSTVILTVGSVIKRKWTFEHENQEIRWACKAFFEIPGGVADSPVGSFATASSNGADPSCSASSSTFSRFAQSARARQRAVEPPHRVSAIYIFLRNLGKIYLETGTDYTFHIPFLVRRVWPLRPHGVLMQRELDDYEMREVARAGIPPLPTLFSLHDPFAEPKVIGVAAKIHGAFANYFGTATTITQPDPNNPPETRTPEDNATSSGYKSANVKAMQAEPPPPPPKPERPPPLQKPPATDKVIWVSEETTNHSLVENIIVTCSMPIQTIRSPPVATSAGGSPDATTTQSLKLPHRYAHQYHLTVWRYTYLKPRETPDPVPSRHKRSRAAAQRKSTESGAETPTPPTPIPQQRDPDAVRRRELQDRADRIAPSSPELPPAPSAFTFPPATAHTTLRQQVGQQPTLTSLPGGELPDSWGHMPQQQPIQGQRHERQESHGRRRLSLSMTMDRMALSGTAGEEGEMILDDHKTETDVPITFMNAGHMRMQPAVWMEKISVIPMPPTDIRQHEAITVYIFDARGDQKFDRSLLAIQFPAAQVLTIYTLVRVPVEDTFRLYPSVHIPAISIVALSSFRSNILDLLVVKPDHSLVILTHGLRTVDVKLAPRPPWFIAQPTEPPPRSNEDDAMAVDSRFDDSDTSMRSIIDREKIVAVSQPLHNSFTVHFEDGTTTRTKLIATPHDFLTSLCFSVLSFALTTPRAFSLHHAWVMKWRAIGAPEDNDQEWTCFVDILCEMLDIQSPYGVKDRPSQLGPWEAMAYTASHDRFEDDHVMELLNAPFRPQEVANIPPRKPKPDADPCFFALHLLGESFKLKNDLAHAFLPRLAKLLIALGKAVRPEWADYWVRMFPENVDGWTDPKREDHSASSKLRPQPPDVYLYLFARLIEPTTKTGWTSLIHISQIYGIEPAMQYGRADPLKDFYRLFNIWECFTDMSVPTARKRAENAMQLIVKSGMTTDDLDRMPYGIVQPIREALRTCQTLPGGNWSPQAYQLILRPDMAQMVAGDAFHVTSRDSFKQADKHLDPSWSRYTVGELIQETQRDMALEPPPITGVELDLRDFTDVRFGSDRRLQEVARMLQSSSPPTIRMPERSDITEHDIAREQQTVALRVAERTLALPIGRGMFTFGSVPTLTRDASRIPKMDYQVRMQPYNTLINVDVSKMNAEAKNWADFHNGVAAGLRILPSSKMVDSSWITFNKPAELTSEHAGFLFGLGLTGHLKNMLTWHTFQYLTPKHDLTSIGVLLGLSAANVGTANRHVTKLLAVHTPALLPNPTVDLNIPMLTQASGLVGTGLLYMGTKNRRMAEVALHEISRTQVYNPDQTTDHREAYTLSAALAFGMIMLGAGVNSASLVDVNMVSRLRLLIHGEPVFPGINMKKPNFDVTLTSAPATLALALMFLKTGRQDIADILAVPNTLLELHHLQPSLLLVRTVGRALIMWDRIVATPQWVTGQLPKNALEALEKRMNGQQIDESLELAYFNIVSGACFAIGLKYAGTAQEDPYSCLIHFHDLFTRIWNQNIGQFVHRIKRAAVRDGLNLMSIALSMIMAGTGEINCLRRFRYAHGQATQPSKYGVHMATHIAIGLLFLGGGRFTLGTSDCAIVCLIAAFFPRFPNLSHENRGQLQALRHLWVLAIEPRCLIGRDVESNEVVYLPVKVKLTDGEQTRSAQLISPTLFPDINRLVSIRVDNPRYFPFVLDIAGNSRHRDVLLRNQTLWVKRRTGHLGYGEDPRGSRSIYVRSGASSGDAAVLDNPRPSDARSPSAIEFFRFMSSFSNEALYVAFADRFCRVPDNNANVDDEELAFAAFSQAAMLECLTLDRAHMLPTYLAIHLTRQRAGTGINTLVGAGCTSLAVRDLAWHDEFYKNIYDARFSGKSDNVALPPLMRRPMLLAVERSLELRMRALRQDPDLRIALRRYHRGEGIVFPRATTSAEHKAQKVLLRKLGFYLTRTNVPPAGVLERMKAEAETTLLSLAAHGGGGEDAVRGLLWNTGVLFAGGVLRPWSVRSLDEVVENWTETASSN